MVVLVGRVRLPDPLAGPPPVVMLLLPLTAGLLNETDAGAILSSSSSMHKEMCSLL
jgi:hypothetical protein